MRHGVGLEVRTKTTGCFLSYWDTRDGIHFDDVIAGLIDGAKRDAKQRIEEWAEEEVTEIWPYRIFDADEGTEIEVAPIPGTTLETDVTIYSFDLADDQNAEGFVFPDGVLPTDDEHDYDPDEIIEGYAKESNNAKDTRIRAVVDGRHIFELWESLIDVLPSIDNLEVSWTIPLPGMDAGELWLTPRWSSRDELKSYLKSTRHLLFDNGWLDLAVYSRKEQTTLRLTSHKEIQFYSENDLHLRAIENAIKSYGIKKSTQLLSLAAGFAHAHFASTPGVSSNQVIEALKAQKGHRVGFFAEDGKLVEQSE